MIDKVTTIVADIDGTLVNKGESIMPITKAALEKPFDKEEELRAKSDRLIELDSLLSLDERVPEIAAAEPAESTEIELKAPGRAVSEARVSYIQRNRKNQQASAEQAYLRHGAITERRVALP